MNTLSEKEHNPHGPFAALRRAVPTGEVIRFLIVGACNTMFSLAVYWLFVHVYTLALPRHQLWITDLASVTSKPIAITASFLAFKHFVFKTQGNYLKEWLKCFAVYGVSTPLELIILPSATKLLQLFALTHGKAPYLAGIVNAVIIAGYSYFAHKKFSFRR